MPHKTELHSQQNYQGRGAKLDNKSLLLTRCTNRHYTYISRNFLQEGKGSFQHDGMSRAGDLNWTMNKLRKPPSTWQKSPSLQTFTTYFSTADTSMTMQYAAVPNRNTTSPHTQPSPSRSVVPSRESEEQIFATDKHWVTRTLRAEALLAAQAAHQEEVKMLGHHQEATRQVSMTLMYFETNIYTEFIHL